MAENVKTPDFFGGCNFRKSNNLAFCRVCSQCGGRVRSRNLYVDGFLFIVDEANRIAVDTAWLGCQQSIDILPVVSSTSPVINVRFSIAYPRERQLPACRSSHLCAYGKTSITTISDVIELFSVQAIGLKTLNLISNYPRRQTSMKSVPLKTQGQRQQRQPT